MKHKTVTGYDVRAGKVQVRTLYLSRKDAARHLESFKGIRGFAVRRGEVIETLTTRKRGKNCHQEIGGSGSLWEDWIAPFATRHLAEVHLFKSLRERVRSRRQDLREAERALAKAVKR